MSLPKSASSPLSSSPSKQSTRRTSHAHSIDRPSIAQQTNDLGPEEPLSQHNEPVANIEPYLAEEERHDDSQSTSQSLFQPFFTLIEDAHTSEYYHPNVHYIFSDDDTDIITEAAFRTLENEQDNFPQSMKGKSNAGRDHNQQRREEGDGEATYDEEGGFPSPRKESLLPDAVPGVRDNYIILDLDQVLPTDGEHEGADTIESRAQSVQPSSNLQTTQQPEQQASTPSHRFMLTSVHSLSPTWQVLNTQVVPAPTFENNSSGEKPVNGGLMLQIQGTTGLPMAVLGKEKERGGQRLEDMMDQFAKRLDELKQVIENGELGMAPESDEALEDPTSCEEPGISAIPVEAEAGSQTRVADVLTDKEQKTSGTEV